MLLKNIHPANLHITTAMETTIKTVLFDIDGTILNCNNAGRASLIQATKETFGTIGRMEKIDFQGKTDPVILIESLEMMGFSHSDIGEKSGDLKARYFVHLEENIHKFEVVLFPGIRKILELLSGRDDVILGLLTGNFYESAMIKLASHDLNRFFEFGAFGDDAPVRDLLPAVAKDRISKLYGLDIDFKNTFIIGDTVYDIRCAKHAGAVSVAVGTGWTGHSVLLDEGPDHFFRDLGDTAAFMNLIDG